MAVQNQTTITLAGSGGAAPYTFQLISDSQTTIPATITGNQLAVDATTLPPGQYGVHLRIIDSLGKQATSIVPVSVADPGIFTILNDDIASQVSSFPITLSIPLKSYGGVGTVTWALVHSITTAPGVFIDSNNNLVFVSSAFGEWTVGLKATDSIGNVVNKVLQLSLPSSQAFAMVDGQVEVLVNVPTTNTGTHSMTLTVGDSTGNTSVRKTLNYNASNSITTIDEAASFVDYLWESGDATTEVIPVLGDLSGFSLSNSGEVVAGNGLVVNLDTSSNTLAFSGPPTSFGNAEVFVPLAILRGSQQVALVTREFTLLSHGGTSNLGAFTCTTIPYKVGDLVGLDAVKPFFNSPHYSKPTNVTVSLTPGSLLPLGLSLDSNTGLIYGNVLAADVVQSVLSYTDSSGSLVGTVTVNWDIQVSSFTVTDNTTVGQIQVPYTGSFANNGASALSTATVYRGRLPQGLTLSVPSPGTSFEIVGTPIESGIFDVWFKVTNQAQQNALVYKRFAVSYIHPLVILTSQLNQLLTGVPYVQGLTAFGGIAPYTWVITSGTLPTGITLNSVSGELTGTTSVTTYNQTLGISVTDSRGVTVTASLALTLNNVLQIDTTSLPLVTPSQQYSYQLLASGGTSPYTWTLASGSPALPGGLTLNSSGLLSGATSVENYTENIVVRVTDGSSNTTTQTLNLQVGITSSILIDSSGVGPIARGGSYHGLLRAYGTGVAPYTWAVTPDSPNPLPTGITLTTDSSSQGATATLSGSTTAIFSNVTVKIRVVDANGNFAVVFLLLSSYSSLTITTSSLPIAIVNGSYSLQLQATGYNPAFTWSLDSTSAALPSGITLSGSGLLSGTATSAYTGNLVIDVTDQIGDTTSKTFAFSAQQSTLANTTTSLPSVTAGRSYTTTLTATGGTTPYVWSLSPVSPALPQGLSLDPGTGILSGTTSQVGYSKNVSIRLTDATGFYVDKSYTLNVASGLQLQTGIDYTANTTTNYLGYEVNGDVTSINPRPNQTFFVVATGVISTNINQPTVSVPSGFTATVQSISAGVAYIQLSGSFSSGSLGDNSFTITFVDTGVTVTSTFKWKIIASSILRLAPLSGTFPIQYLD